MDQLCVRLTMVSVLRMAMGVGGMLVISITLHYLQLDLGTMFKTLFHRFIMGLLKLLGNINIDTTAVYLYSSLNTPYKPLIAFFPLLPPPVHNSLITTPPIYSILTTI